MRGIRSPVIGAFTGELFFARGDPERTEQQTYEASFIKLRKR